MNSSRRWLVGFAISIGAVAVIAVAVVLLTQGKKCHLAGRGYAPGNGAALFACPAE